MATELNSLIFNKPTEPDFNRGSLEDFGFATGEIDFMADVEMKGYASRNVPGEDGERVFFPDNPAIEPYDLTIEFKYQGTYVGFYDAYTTFCDYLIGRDGTGPCMHIYSPWSNMGRLNTYVKSIKNEKFHREGENIFMSMSVVFRITDPVQTIKLAVS